MMSVPIQPSAQSALEPPTEVRRRVRGRVLGSSSPPRLLRRRAFASAICAFVHIGISDEFDDGRGVGAGTGRGVGFVGTGVGVRDGATESVGTAVGRGVGAEVLWQAHWP